MADSRIDDLRRRVERDPASRLFAQLAEEHRKAGDHAEAIRIARAGLVLHPSYPSARLTLGRALLDSGDGPGARVELEAALRDAPDNILASRFLGQALEAIGELGPALVQLRNTLKMAPGDRQLESQIVALQARLRAAPAAPVAPVRPPASVLTAHASAAEEPPAPTLRLSTLRDPGIPARRTAPPPLPASAAGGARPVVPAVPPAPPVAEERALAELPLQPAPLYVEPFYEWDVAPTLPGAFAPERAPVAEEAPGPVPPPEPLAGLEAVLEEATAPAATPLASSTLAELYHQQGLTERAIEVYRQLLADAPGNEKARGRLAELVGETAAGADGPRDVRRRALERTIVGLEALLAALRRR